MINKACIVVGADFGDEGKGHVIDYLIARLLKDGYNPLIVKPNGGGRSGHDVICGNFNHDFHILGACSESSVPTFLMKNYCICPQVYSRELDVLYRNCLTRYTDFESKELLIHGGCRIITPLDIIYSILRIETGYTDMTRNPGFVETIERCKTQKRTTMFKNDCDSNEFLSSDLFNIDCCKKIIDEHQLRLSKDCCVSKYLFEFDNACQPNESLSFKNILSEMKKKNHLIKGKRDIGAFIKDRNVNSLVFECDSGLAENKGSILDEVLPGLLWILNSLNQKNDVELEVFYVTKTFSTHNEQSEYAFYYDVNKYERINGIEMSNRIKQDYSVLQNLESRISTPYCKNYKSSLVVTCLDITDSCVMESTNDKMNVNDFVKTFDLPMISHLSYGKDRFDIVKI